MIGVDVTCPVCNTKQKFQRPRDGGKSEGVMVNSYTPVTVNLGGTPDRSRLTFTTLPPFNLPDSPRVNLRGLKLVYQLRATQGVRLKLNGKDKRGNPVSFPDEQIVATSSDEALLSVVVVGGLIEARPVGPLGSAQVQVNLPDVDADTEGDQTLSGLLDIEIVSGVAVAIDFQAAETFALEDTPVPEV